MINLTREQRRQLAYILPLLIKLQEVWGRSRDVDQFHKWLEGLLEYKETEERKLEVFK